MIVETWDSQNASSVDSSDVSLEAMTESAVNGFYFLPAFVSYQHGCRKQPVGMRTSARVNQNIRLRVKITVVDSASVEISPYGLRSIAVTLLPAVAVARADPEVYLTVFVSLSTTKQLWDISKKLAMYILLCAIDPSQLQHLIRKELLRPDSGQELLCVQHWHF